MLKYFFKLAFRNIRKYKVNTLISLLGLTVGLTSFILISSYIKHEFSFNKFNDNFDRTYIANIDFYHPNGIESGLNMPYPLVEGLVSEFPEIECGVRFNRIFAQLANGDTKFFENTGYFVDDAFFDIFSVKVLNGKRENPLEEPNTIVLTKSYAKKYFKDENPIGKSILYEGNRNLKITAVIDDFPINSDFRYDFLVSFKTYLAINSYRDYTERWNNHVFFTLFLVDKDCNYEKLNEKISGFLDNRENLVERVLYFRPLSKFHLSKHKNDEGYMLLVILAVMAFFILIIACINFINLSIANASNRIKETSIRRIVGSKKSSLILQQIGESVLLSFIALDIALLIAERSLNSFNAILHTQIPSSLILNFPFIAVALFTAIFLGAVSGLFPAIRISKIEPLTALSGKESGIVKAGLAKKGLIVFQYTISIVLLISTIFLSQQFRFIKEKDLGFDEEFLLSCYVGKENNESNPNLKNFSEEMLRQSGVENVSLVRGLPFYGNSGIYIRKDNSPEEEVIQVNVSVASISFFETFNVNILHKSEGSINNTESEIEYCYINETTANKLGFDNPVGEYIISNDEKYEIIGVYNDFHLYAVESKIPAQIIFPIGKNQEYDGFNWMIIKCNEHNLDKVKETANLKLKEFLPDNPNGFFKYGDTDFKDGILKEVKGIEKTFGFFTIIAIVIACMGIFGLVALTVKHKTKEIGIRKVLGSSASEIFGLIAREYLFLAILGNVLAWFPAWYFSKKMIQDFAYHIEISIWVFVFAFVSSILLTIITIAFHTIKAARTNPVEALRYE
jgi:putative ABC transport system permease protein